MHRLFIAICLLLSSWAQAQSATPVVVGSKRFTESYVLGEVVRQTLEAAGVPAQHQQGLGNTGILEQALASGKVDVYPEYTGTIVRDRTYDIVIAHTTARPSGTNSDFAAPVKNVIGKNTMQIHSIEMNAGTAICCAPSRIAVTKGLW